MSEKLGPGETNIDEEVALGRILRKRYPGAKSPYEALQLAYRDMQNESSGGKIGKFAIEAMPDAIADFRPTGPQSFDIGVDQGYMNTIPMPKGYDREEWKLGVLGHEVLGHGGDQAFYGPGLWDAEHKRNKPKGRHFMDSPYKRAHQDSIDWLNKAIEQRFSDIDEAKSRGLPYMLPEKRKGE